MINLSNGEYFAFVDDDDDVEDWYIEEMLKAIEQKPDVITFLQHAHINNKDAVIDFDLDHKENDIFVPDRVVKRMPFHVCGWRKNGCEDIEWKESNWGEDWIWAEQALRLAKTQVKINKHMHIYYYNSDKSRAYYEDR